MQSIVNCDAVHTSEYLQNLNSKAFLWCLYFTLLLNWSLNHAAESNMPMRMGKVRPSRNIFYLHPPQRYAYLTPTEVFFYNETFLDIRKSSLYYKELFRIARKLSTFPHTEKYIQNLWTYLFIQFLAMFINFKLWTWSKMFKFIHILLLQTKTKTTF